MTLVKNFYLCGSALTACPVGVQTVFNLESRTDRGVYFLRALSKECSDLRLKVIFSGSSIDERGTAAVAENAAAANSYFQGICRQS